MIIAPHGGKLVNRVAKGKRRDRLLKKARKMKRVELNGKQISDLEMIATGVFSPLEGFMDRKDYESVVENMRLYNGLVWTIPITLDVSRNKVNKLEDGEEIALVDKNRKILGTLLLEEKYFYNKEKDARLVYKTTDKKHPGVKNVYSQGDILLGGKITLLNRSQHKNFKEYRLDPKDTRRIFKKKRWERIVAFQTRNPVHRAHEYLQKCALETVDGLFLHPLVGETKIGDIPSEVVMECYKTVLEHYYPKDRTLLAVFPAFMRYAGPREAIFHAICRKNYGCTHFIVGRDHAGVGNYYGTYDAQNIFNEFEEVELTIVPIMFDHAFYCKRCKAMATKKTCPHDKEEHVFLSGTKLREMLHNGLCPPEEFTRPEIAEILIKTYTKGK